MIAVLSFLISASATLAWDKDLSPEVTGYHVYKGKNTLTYLEMFDVGNNLTFKATKLIPTQPYFFAVTAYTASGLESDLSSEVSYTPPLPPLSLSITKTTLTATVFGGGSFELQHSSDLYNWDLYLLLQPTVDTAVLPLPNLGPNAFFRLKFAGLSGLEPTESLPSPKINRQEEVPVLKLTWLQKLRLFLKYRSPGKQADERKGAERLREKND